MSQKVKLFQTVADIYNRGDIELSASDRRVIESETQELIRKSMFRRHAAKMPEGFDKVLDELKEAKESQEAFDLVVDFLKAEGVLDGDKGDDKPEKPEKSEKEKKPPVPKKDDEEDESEEEESEEEESEEEESEEEESEEEDEDDKELVAARKAVKTLAKRVRSQDAKPAPIKDKGEKPGKPDGKKKDVKEESGLEKIQDAKKKEEKSMPSVDEMGLDKKQLMRANKSRVVVTAEGNVVAHHADLGPVFYSTPKVSTRRSRKALARLANKIKALITYEGWERAAQACNARVLRAGVDDDIETVGGDVSPATEPVTSGGDSDTREQPTSAPGVGSDVVKGLDTDTEDKPKPKTSRGRRTSTKLTGFDAIDAKREDSSIVLNKYADPTEDAVDDISIDFAEDVAREDPSLIWCEVPGSKAGRRKPARRRPVRGGVADNPEVVTDEKPPQQVDELNDGVTDGGETDMRDQSTPKPSNSSLKDGDVDFKVAQLESRYRRLYQARAEKAVAAEVEKFARKFSRCVKIASRRMLLNHTPHNFKAAMVDVLAADDGSVQFADGDAYRGMDQRTAVELTELIAAEGHESFVDALMKDAASLIAKDEKYLQDVEDDLGNLAPVDVTPAAEPVATAKRSRKASKIRNRMAKGNFNVEVKGSPAQTSNKDNSAGIGAAISGSTRLGRRLGYYEK